MYQFGWVRSLSPKSTGGPRARRGLPIKGQRPWRAWEEPVGPRGQADGSVGSGSVFGFALLEPEALAVHLENVDVMREAVEERAREAFRSKDLGPFIEGQEVTRIEPRS